MVDLPRHIFDAIWQGRAALIVGQELVSGDTQALIHQAAADSLRKALLRPTRDFLDNVTRLRESDPDSAHVEIAQLPWALVISSALETRLVRALEAAAPAARRVRRRFVDDPDADSLVRSPTTLEVMHLSLFSSPTSPDGVLPEANRWSRATRLMQPRVLERLKDAIGPAHYVIIAGVGSADTLDREDLAASLEGIDDAQVVLCEPQVDDTAWLRDYRPGAIILNASLDQLLQKARVEAPQAVPDILRADDLLVTARSIKDGGRQVATFRAEELRDVRRHLDILGDRPGQITPATRDERLRAFRKFLRTPRLRADYQTFVGDFCLARQAYQELFEAVIARVGRVSGATARLAGRRTEGPIWLKGLPGSGRTTGLHWLGIRLREEGWPVAHLSSPVDEPDTFAIEQIMRLTEQRLKDAGAIDLVVLLVDGVARENVERLEERLVRAGRRSIVVATAVSSSPVSDEEEERTGDEITLDYQLAPEELSGLGAILESVGIAIDAEVLQREAGTEGFLGMLDRLSVDAREGLGQVLRSEFNRFIPSLAQALRKRPPDVKRGALGEAIIAAFAKAGRPAGLSETQGPLAPDRENIEEARNLMSAIFAFAWLDRVMPLDLLGRRFPQLFAAYEDVRIVAQEHGFLTEVTLDDDGDIALAIVNPAIARALRTHVVGGPRDVLRELQAFANSIAWPVGPDDNGLTHWPAFLHGLLRSVSPRGSFRGEFGSVEDLRQLGDILSDLRQVKGVQSAQMLMLEAIVLRELADRGNLPGRETEEILDRSRLLLTNARDQIAKKPRNPSRDQLLASILTSYATTLRRQMQVRIEQGNLPAAQTIAAPALAAAQRAQALQDQWHPFDAAALVYYRLAQAWQSERQLPEARQQYLNAVDQLGTLFDLASELSELPQDQQERKSARQREYLYVTGQLEVAKEQALAEAEDGDLTALSHVLRMEAIDPVTNQIRSVSAAKLAFDTLAKYPAAFENERSVVLLHRLWVGVHLGLRALDKGPHLIGAGDDEWRNLQRIEQRRLELGREFDPAIGFWLSLALLQLGNLVEARRVLQSLTSFIGRPRKRQFEPLILISTPDANARSFRALVRRRGEREDYTVYIRELDIETTLWRRYLEAGEAIDLKQGDLVEVHVALNYRGPMAIGPRWTARALRTSSS